MAMSKWLRRPALDRIGELRQDASATWREVSLMRPSGT